MAGPTETLPDVVPPEYCGKGPATSSGFMSSPRVAGTCVTFRKVAFSLQGKKKSDPPIQILENVSGYFAPGTLTATMGPSGAGKTTFLDIVTGRKNRGKIEGELLYRGRVASKAYLKSDVAYVEQFDNLLGVLTVRGMLLYQAELKGSRREPLASKRARIEKLVVQLGLEKCANVPIGDALHPGISGGQAKRTNIGIALVTEPRVLFLDEPTSGLDSMTSLDVVGILRSLANEGVTIMSTIHSPTSEAFRLFDSLLLLVKGRSVYFGPLHGESGVVQYFESFNIVFDPATNLADFLIRETGERSEVNFADNWEKSARAEEAHAKLDRWVKDTASAGNDQLDQDRASTPSERDEQKVALPHNGFTAILVLLRYRTKANYRFADFVAPRVAPMFLFGFIIGSLYFKVGDDAAATDPIDVAARGNVAAAIFMCTALPSFTAAGYMPSIVAERPLFYRETNDGCYSVFSYVVYKLIEEAIPQMFSTAVFCLITFFMIGFKGSCLWYCMIFFFTGQTGIALAYVCAGVARNMDEANTLLPVYNVLGMFFTGVLFTYKEIPTGWRWYPWTSFVRYAWSAHMVNNFGSECEVGPYSPIFRTPGCPIEYWGIDVGSAGTEVWKNVLALLSIWVFFVCLVWFTMANVRHVRR